MQKLNPEMAYDFNKNDEAFIIELAKVGHVHLLSHQVSLVTNESKGLEFKSYSSRQECRGLTLPENWVIEYIGSNDKNRVFVTFGVTKK